MTTAAGPSSDTAAVLLPLAEQSMFIGEGHELQPRANAAKRIVAPAAQIRCLLFPVHMMNAKAMDEPR